MILSFTLSEIYWYVIEIALDWRYKISTCIALIMSAIPVPQAHIQVNDLFTDLSDGKVLMKLLEIISGESLGRPNRGVLRVQKMENVNRCLQFLATKVT